MDQRWTNVQPAGKWLIPPNGPSRRIHSYRGNGGITSGTLLATSVAMSDFVARLAAVWSSGSHRGNNFTIILQAKNRLFTIEISDYNNLLFVNSDIIRQRISFLNSALLDKSIRSKNVR